MPKEFGFTLFQNPAILNRVGGKELLPSMKDSAHLPWRSESLISVHREEMDP